MGQIWVPWGRCGSRGCCGAGVGPVGQVRVLWGRFGFHRAGVGPEGPVGAVGQVRVLWGRFGSRGAGNVPEELRDPFYTDQYAQEHLKPPVERLLLASDLYCRAWCHALATPGQAPPTSAAPSKAPPPEPPPADLGALLGLLAGRGVPPTLQGVPVRVQDLQQRPIRMVLGILGALGALGVLGRELGGN
ncbi:PREDICTED: calmodulin-regulated spectrin-associated protein 3-like [Lepidothrix coronata]|uniref:Calmodulin-regulated spectrin-associated protein 3-like n=1 Tax=Lepidothrix coronata TaxID=321398 RepID=A0A6J0JAX0_9PASS|nr:PREDICTED: calmodulin-regulated spectrin-associated protein 3-like [Lepidothrix coronata]